MQRMVIISSPHPLQRLRLDYPRADPILFLYGRYFVFVLPIGIGGLSPFPNSRLSFFFLTRLLFIFYLFLVILLNLTYLSFI